MSSSNVAPRLRRSELIGALSLAVDLGLGRPMEQGLRTCLLSTRLGSLLGLSQEELATVYHLSLLRFIGCNAERQLIATYFGDEMAFSAKIGPLSQGSNSEMMGMILRSAGHDRPLARRVLAAGGVIASKRKFDAQTRAHCEVGAMLAGGLGFGPGVEESLRHAFERWDGKGGPARLKGEQIALEMRIAQVAYDAEVYYGLGGLETSVETVMHRAGAGLDPSICETYARHAGELTDAIETESAWEAVIAAEPGEPRVLHGEELEAGLRVCAGFVDMVSPHLAGHSSGVGEIASSAAPACGLSEEDAARLRHSGYVHDLGRTGVSVSIWDKPGALSEGEWERVRLHPYFTERTLARSEFLSALGSVASLNHERLDGSGYHRGLPAGMLSTSARVLAAADVFKAVTEERAYRPARSMEEAVREIRTEAKAGRLDGQAVEAVLEAVGQRGRRTGRDWPRGLTTREVEVLREIALGHPTKEIANRLVISVKTVDNHIQHIYDKLDVSTRPAAALFAIQNDLLDLAPAQR